MPVLPPLTDDQVSEELRPIWSALRARFGKVINIYGTMAHAPAILQASLDLSETTRSGLDLKLRELAYLLTSKLNNCDYCLHYHRATARKAGLTPEQIDQLAGFETSDVYSSLDKDVLRFAEQWTRHGRVSLEVMHRLRSLLSPDELVTLAGVVGLANWTNRFIAAFGVELP